MPSRSTVVMSALWLAGLAAATSVGLVAVGQVGNQVGDEAAAPLTGTAIRQALSSSQPVTPTAGPADEPTSAPSPSGDDGLDDAVGEVQTASSSAGVVSARCRNGSPVLVLATPAVGYRTEQSTAAGSIVVRFLGGQGQTVISLRCSGTQLRLVRTYVPNGSTPAPEVPTTRPLEPSRSPTARPTPVAHETETPEPTETESDPGT